LFPTQVPGANELSHDGVLYLAPVGSVGTPPRPVKWPKLIGKSVVYSLTAWNPMGRDAPHATSVEPKLALQPSVSWLPGGFFQRRSVPQTASSSGQPRPNQPVGLALA
jgi:hypothetical protein